LTGATGFLGKATYACLTETGHNVIPVGHGSMCYQDQMSLDLEDVTLDSLRGQLPSVDAMIHLASKVDFGQRFNETIYKVNTTASIMLAQMARERGIKFIFSSTAIIAGSLAPHISLSSIPSPDVPYALSKWIAERGIMSTLEDYAILRFAGIFGLNGPSHLGLNNTIRSALNGEIPQIKGSGKAKRNYIYVRDAARAIQYCLDKDVKGVHLIAGTEVLSIKQMLEFVCREYMPQKKPIFVGGAEAGDQLIEPSSLFPETRTFLESLHDIKQEYKKACRH